jgi:putative oxidoreductase
MENALRPWSPQLLSVLRIMTALLILQHGMGKILGFPPNPAYAGVQLVSLIGAAGMIELIGGTLLLLGLFTRPAAFILSGELAFAYFIGHWPRGFFPILNAGTLAVLYCFIFLYLAAAGPGPWSLDRILRGKD